jgi:hypothetical protein
MEEIKDSNPLPIYITERSAVATRKRCSYREAVTVLEVWRLIRPKAGRMR